MKHLLAVVVAALCLFAANTAEAQVVNWRLKFQSEKPQSISVRFGGTNQVFWYVPYTITNNSTVDVDVSLLFYIATDSGKDYTDTLNPVAERAIIIREAKLEQAESIDESIAALKSDKKYLNSNEIAQKITIGETWHGIAIFNEIDRNMDRMIFQIGGLANIVRVKSNKIVRMVEVYRMYYERPGDEFEVHLDRIKHKNYMDRWVEVAGFADVRKDKDGTEENWVKAKWER